MQITPEYSSWTLQCEKMRKDKWQDKETSVGFIFPGCRMWKAMPQCWWVKQKENCTQWIALRETFCQSLRNGFISTARRNIASVQRHKNWEIHPLHSLCWEFNPKLSLRRKYTSASSFEFLFIFFAGGYEKDDTEHSELSQGISTVITLGIWGRISPFGEKEYINVYWITTLGK